VTKIDWLGTQSFCVAAIDVAGNYSPVATTSFAVAAPGAVRSLTGQAINERVLIDWIEPNSGTLPLDFYRVYKGASGSSFGSAARVYEARGTFAPMVEISGGQFTYWVVAVDVNGNVGPESGITLTVLPPVDFIIRDDQQLETEDGTLVNMLSLDDGYTLAAPVNPSITWIDSFGDNDTLHEEINAGYTHYLEPSSLTPGTAEWTIDYGVVLSSSTISVTWVLTEVDPTVSLTCNIQTSDDDIDYTDRGDISQVFVQAFRYAKITLTIEGLDDSSLAYLGSMQVKVTLKKSTDSGTANVAHADSGGTTIAFNLDFLDIESINVTPIHNSTAQYAIVNFDFSEPNPTEFKVLLFDVEGARLDGAVSWTAFGAQDVLGVS
jgi:hypothetical protein